MNPITYDPRGALSTKDGVTAEDLKQLSSQLEAARRETYEVDRAQLESGDIPAEKEPLDAAFIDLPKKLLAEYDADKDGSELGRILATAKQLQEQVDRVVVLGIGGSYMGARALMEGCCHPYHNELSKAARDGRPRMYFEGNNVDNDASAGLLALLKEDTEPWGLIVISKSGGTLETAAAFRQFFNALVESCGGDRDLAVSRTVPVTGTEGKLFDLMEALGRDDKFPVPDGVGGRFSILSAVGLLPAAVLGLDVVALLRGAVAMNDHFASAPVGENVVLDYVGVCRLWEERGANLRILSAWSKGLESTGLWYDQLLAESLGKAELGATPITVVNTRDLHSRAQQHQEGRRDKLVTNLIVDQWQEAPLAVGKLGEGLNQDQLDQHADRSLPELMSAAIAGTNEAYQNDNRPTADMHLPQCDEATLGQLFQMFMLATVVEGRMMGINPYGQPGVELYKQNMKRILES